MTVIASEQLARVCGGDGDDPRVDRYRSATGTNTEIDPGIVQKPDPSYVYPDAVYKPARGWLDKPRRRDA